jgi:DNA recombination protein RmuC
VTQQLIDVLVGLVIGVVLGALAARQRAATRLARLEATLGAAKDGEGRLEQAMRALSFEATAQSHEAVARAVAPLHDALRRYEEHLAGLERDRVDAYAQLRTQLGQAQADTAHLRAETGRLVGALRSPQVRGRWGEHQLRRIVEASGMLAHCDFAEQVTIPGEDGAGRPDLVVSLHGGRHLVVDAKVPLDAYLSAMEAKEDRARDTLLDAHARALRAHVDALAAKRYWAGLPQTPEFVVLFVPADPFLDAALSRDATMLEHAFSRNVVIATPATLVALLRTVAFAWRQESLAHNALQVHQIGRELYGRIAGLTEHLSRLGTSLGGAVNAYNRAVGALETRVLVSARRLAQLGVAGEDVANPGPVEIVPRQPTGQIAEALEPGASASTVDEAGPDGLVEDAGSFDGAGPFEPDGPDQH